MTDRAERQVGERLSEEELKLGAYEGAGPCNICGYGWPYHAEACAYAALARQLAEAERENGRLREAAEEAVAQRIGSDSVLISRDAYDKLDAALAASATDGLRNDPKHSEMSDTGGDCG